MKRVGLVVLVIALSGLAMSAVAAPTLQANYNGNTGNGGLDADYAVGVAGTIYIGANSLVGPPPHEGPSALDATQPNSGARYEAAGNLAPQGTIMMWALVPELEGRGMHLFWAASDDNTVNMSYQQHSAFGGLFRTTPGGDLWVGGGIAPGWHHIAATWGAGATDRNLYVDGAFVAGGAGGGLLTAATHLSIGNATPGHEATQHWGGMIDCLRVFDTVLDAPSVEMQMQDCSIVPEPASLLVLLTGAIGLAGVIRRRS